jgi:hypothetical protein
MSLTLLFVLCWYQGLILCALAVYALLSGVPVLISLCLDVYYQTFGEIRQGRILLSTDYRDDGLDQQFLVAVVDDDAGGSWVAPSTTADAVIPSHGTPDERSNETTLPTQWWIFHPACFTDHEHPHRPRWPAQGPGDVVDVVVLPRGRGCRMRDLRFDDCLQSCGLGLGVLLFAAMGAVMIFLYVGMLFVLDAHCAGGGCCAWETKVCSLFTLFLYLINVRLWSLRTYEGDRLGALAKRNGDEYHEEEESEQVPKTVEAVVEQGERELV